MKLYQSQLCSIHSSLEVRNVFFPDDNRSIFGIRVSHAAFSQCIVLVFLNITPDYIVPLSFKILPNRYFLIESIPSGLKLFQNIIIPNGIIALLEKFLYPDTLKSINHVLFPLKVVLISIFKTTLSPRREFIIDSFSSALKTSMFERKKNSLFKAKFSYQSTHSIISGLKLFAFH